MCSFSSFDSNTRRRGKDSCFAVALRGRTSCNKPSREDAKFIEEPEDLKVKSWQPEMHRKIQAPANPIRAIVKPEGRR